MSCIRPDTPTLDDEDVFFEKASSSLTEVNMLKHRVHACHRRSFFYRTLVTRLSPVVDCILNHIRELNEKRTAEISGRGTYGACTEVLNSLVIPAMPASYCPESEPTKMSLSSLEIQKYICAWDLKNEMAELLAVRKEYRALKWQHRMIYAELSRVGRTRGSNCDIQDSIAELCRVLSLINSYIRKLHRVIIGPSLSDLVGDTTAILAPKPKRRKLE